MSFASDWLTSKVTWTALAGIAIAVGQWYLNQITLPEMLAAVFAALGVAFLRDTHAKSAENTVAAVHANTEAVHTVARLQAVDTAASVATADAAVAQAEKDTAR